MDVGNDQEKDKTPDSQEMKIGILTFHACCNFGAVVQAWALQTYLTGCGQDAVVINYEPVRATLPWWMVALRRRDFKRLYRDWQFRFFRRCHMCETKQVSSVSDVAALGLDAVVVGSDQVWNVEYFTKPDGRYNELYFLHGDIGKAKKLAYAASIGHGGWADYRWKEELLADVRDFDAISVREEVARNELAAFGVDATLVPDPTLLLEREDYCRIAMTPNIGKPYVFSYLLSEYNRVRPIVERVSLAKRTDAYLTALSSIHDSNVDFLSPGKWLGGIRGARFVITDSFHGTALSIIFNIPFATVLKFDKPKMNSRVTELLERTGLSGRIAESAEDALRFFDEPVDWNAVNRRLEEIRKCGRIWLEERINPLSGQC